MAGSAAQATEQYGDQQHQTSFNVSTQVIPDWLQDWLEKAGVGYLIRHNAHREHPIIAFYQPWAIHRLAVRPADLPQQRALFPVGPVTTAS